MKKTMTAADGVRSKFGEMLCDGGGKRGLPRVVAGYLGLDEEVEEGEVDGEDDGDRMSMVAIGGVDGEERK